MIELEIIALLFLLVYIVQSVFYFFLLSWLLQLTKNQVNQFYILDTLEERENIRHLILFLQ